MGLHGATSASESVYGAVAAAMNPAASRCTGASGGGWGPARGLGPVTMVTDSTLAS